MIFASLALLLVSAALLVAGIGKSHLAMLVFSLIAAVAGAVLLLVAHQYHRLRLAAGADGGLDPAASPAAPPSEGPPALAGNGHLGHAHSAGADGALPPVPGYDELTAQDAAAVADTLNLEELHALRRYEVEHANRRSVLRAIDRRIEAIVEVRRRVSAQG